MKRRHLDPALLTDAESIRGPGFEFKPEHDIVNAGKPIPPLVELIPAGPPATVSEFKSEDDKVGLSGQQADGNEQDDSLATHHALLSHSPLSPGVELLGRFHLLCRYEGSGQSTVWAAWAIAEKRFVVLKFVAVRTRLLMEAQKAANVSGNVLAVYEYNTAIPDNPFLVLEYASGGPVSRLAKTWARNPGLLI